VHKKRLFLYLLLLYLFLTAGNVNNLARLMLVVNPKDGNVGLNDGSSVEGGKGYFRDP